MILSDAHRRMLARLETDICEDAARRYSAFAEAYPESPELAAAAFLGGAAEVSIAYRKSGWRWRDHLTPGTREKLQRLEERKYGNIA